MSSLSTPINEKLDTLSYDFSYDYKVDAAVSVHLEVQNILKQVSILWNKCKLFYGIAYLALTLYRVSHKCTAIVELCLAKYGRI
jgi:hypothetical protein